jgi:hypothetical protein
LVVEQHSLLPPPESKWRWRSLPAETRKQANKAIKDNNTDDDDEVVFVSRGACVGKGGFASDGAVCWLDALRCVADLLLRVWAQDTVVVQFGGPEKEKSRGIRRKDGKWRHHGGMSVWE